MSKRNPSTLILLSLLLLITSALAGHPLKTVAADPNATPPNYKIAVIGDSGYGSGFEAVLTLIQTEGAQLVLHEGDFDYVGDTAGWMAKVDTILGSDFPYLISVGNHDAADWPSTCGNAGGCYADFATARMAANSIVPDDPNLDDEKYAVTYQGLRLVFVGQNGSNTDFAQYLSDQIGVGDQIWKICNWHKNQNKMQMGTKADEMGWSVYENCINAGALILTGHEHSYSRTRTLINAENQIVDPGCSEANAVCVAEGKSFVVVSGLGGHSVRNQDRCLPYTFPYGCRQEWASVYTSDQSANFGALFITFHVDGDPYKARGYYKDINGNVIDEFEITTKETTANLDPITPTNPVPGDSTTGNSTTTDLSWTGGDPEADPVVYDLYLDTSSPPGLMQRGLTQPGFDPGTLNDNTTYYWQVVAADDQGGTAVGPIWHFSTGVNPANFVTQNIAMDQGWNMFSSYLLPQDLDLAVTFAPIAADLNVIKNTQGDIFWPDFNINQIEWDTCQGYLANLAAPATPEITGAQIVPEQTACALEAGWNMIAYLRDSAMPPATALATCATETLLVKNGAGELYWPAQNIDEIGSLIPGQGYQLYLSAPCTLIYPANNAP